MSNRLKQITTKAKALYKTGKFAKWTDAIKAASKQISKTKKVGYAGRRYKIEKEITKEIKSAPKELFPFTKNQQLIKAGKKVFDKKYKELHDNKNINGMKKKKAAPKKKSSYHKDTKSHNVNIKVVSGTNELKKLVYYHVPTKLSNEYEELKKGETNLANFIFLSKLKNLTKEQKKEVIKQIKYWKSHVKATKNNILILKKHL